MTNSGWSTCCTVSVTLVLVVVLSTVPSIEFMILNRPSELIVPEPELLNFTESMVMFVLPLLVISKYAALSGLVPPSATGGRQREAGSVKLQNVGTENMPGATPLPCSAIAIGC